MTQRREIEGRLALYEDLSGILGAMRSFALAELHRIGRRETAEQQVVRALTQTLREVSVFLPPSPRPAADVWLLIGSVRGFCGSFNEDVVHAWQASQGAKGPVLVVGERLVSILPADFRFVAVPGAESGLDAANAIDRILAALAETRGVSGGTYGLVACFRDEREVRIQRLLPLPVDHDNTRLPPLMNEPPAKVAAGVAEHFLFHTLLALLLRAIRVENRMRLMQMENALSHLERSSEELKRRRNRMRQEEIVEEIELMPRGRAGMDMR